MRRVIFPSVDPAISKNLSMRHSQQRPNGCAAGASRPRMSGAEVYKWARLLIDQYGAEAEELAEIGVLEMLALKNGAHLVAWSAIYAAIRDIRSREPKSA